MQLLLLETNSSGF